METLKKNQTYTAVIDGYGSQAQGVCHIGGRAVFVPRALPGESWEIKILKVTNTAVYARGEKLLLPSPGRREPDCQWFGLCGGCDCRHMSYEEELAPENITVTATVVVGDGSLLEHDFNQDDEVNVLDVMTLAQSVVGTAQLPEGTDPDLDHNQIVDVRDVMILAQQVVSTENRIR